MNQSVVELDEIKPGCWINLIQPTKKEIKKIIEKTGISKQHLLTALDEDERPHFDKELTDNLIVFKIPLKTETQSKLKIKTIPIGIIITDNYFITIQLTSTELFKDFYEGNIKEFYTTKRTRFLIQILSRTNFYFLKYLDKIESEITKIESGLMRSLKNEEVIKLFELQKTLIYFHTAIMANGNVLESILKGRVVRLYKEDEDILDDIIIENKQSLEMTNTYNNILSNTLDAYASVISNNLNLVMKILTSLTIILSIPAIISSFYGMNINLPFQNNQMAFFYTLLVSFCISGLIALVFLRKGWL
jgi:magnesium transporter